MPDLSLEITKAAAVPYAAAPLLALTLRITNADASETIHTIVLRCQIQIEVRRRTYVAREQEKLRDLFGDRERWGDTLRNMVWTHSSLIVPSFSASTVADLHVPCTFDFNVAATKYFNGVETGEIPLCLMFSGTVFYANREGTLEVAPIPWDKEARFRLPVSVWKEMMDHYYPGCAWLSLGRDAFDRLYQYKVRRGIPTWEKVIENLLPALEEAVSS